jgi:L-cysteine:1D-myo-inositol 2-amino-2-deoxy-alpha-D-glucopyranoside ligase
VVATGPAPGRSGEVRLYVCGITPYDAAHLGHVATYVAFDVAQRVWRDAGHSVRYIQNVTDIDDPLLERAARDGEDWRALAQREIVGFREDMAALSVIPPEKYVGVVESIEEIAEMVEKLRAEGVAYELHDDSGDLYFDLTTAPDFGYESRLDSSTMKNLFAEHGGDPTRSGKRSPLDPLLWRAARPGEPSWSSQVGPGRPGWHVECALISVKHLGMGIDVQGGGVDLLFPHHEMSAAHAEVAYGQHPFARAYVHAGLIGWEGEKMSKSRGNLVFASRLRRDGVAPSTIRLALLAGHYRSDRAWSAELLQSATERWERWSSAAALHAGPDTAPLLGAVRSCLVDDLDTPGALAVIDTWVDAALAGAGESEEAPSSLAAIAEALLGVSLAARQL